jgi:siroheme synthase-like protein
MNPLYPVFLKPSMLRFLIVGGGPVGEEKLTNLLRSSPEARVRVVAPEMRPEIFALAEAHPQVELIPAYFDLGHLDGIDVAILAAGSRAESGRIRSEIKARGGVLVNVADTPDLCDFYMCSIITKGDLKVGISTNGKSPTLAKRFRELLEDILPDEIPELLNNLRTIRDRLKGDFEYKVKALNDLTASMVAQEQDPHRGE